MEQLNDVQIDTLKEIGNIGQGNAASALSSIMGKMIDISVPNVKILDFDKTVKYLGGEEQLVVGILFGITGEINGMLIQVLSETAACGMVNPLMNDNISSLSELNNMNRSCLEEIGNILAGSYINAIASLTGMTIDISVPSLTIDMAGAILSVPAVKFSMIGDKVLLIDDSFIIDNGELKSNIILIPEIESLSVLFSKLGVGN
ncbi:MAG: chemotaxis protein CheC [Oscillospiraceae bacterium]|nr:chemotaxis protein CheC [Oscillospiraceae bacterium]MBQ4312405.1 chemotaxis protein CheC [Oscillospiraceae bacterium]MCR5165870.1 chemotaxis protein CheC [Oscillospiraceae bacterium]